MTKVSKVLVAAMAVVAVSGCNTGPGAMQCGPGTDLQGDVCVSTGLSPCPGGTVLVGADCKPMLSCGTGTFEQNAQCLPTAGSTQLVCGTDTQASNGACVSSLHCGTGTARTGNTCVGTSSTLTCGTGTTLSNNSCVVSLASVCGTDTTSSGSQCVSSLSCGSGTARSGSQCVGTSSSLTCGSGTTLSGNSCVSNVSCGSGTTLSGNSCVGSLSCGTGTTLSGNSCVASTTSTVTCGAGTVLTGSQCLPAPITTGTVGSFLAGAGLVKGSSNSATKRFLVTNLSQGNADAWAATGAAMVGSGRGLHIANWSNLAISTGTTIYWQVEDSSDGAGHCLGGLSPADTSTASAGVVVNSYNWVSGVATPGACGVTGTVKATYNYNATLSRYQLALLLNVVFTDGSTLTDYPIAF